VGMEPLHCKLICYMDKYSELPTALMTGEDGVDNTTLSNKIRLLNSTKELEDALKKTKDWLHEKHKTYDEKVENGQTVWLRMHAVGLDIPLTYDGLELVFATNSDSISAIMKTPLEENQINITSEMNEKDRIALKFHFDKEIASDPFLFNGHLACNIHGQFYEILLRAHPIYFDSLTKEKLMHTMHMLYKSETKYSMLIQEHTHYPD
jgi:hypothetical protein